MKKLYFKSVYLLGVNEPLETFEGMVIAVYHRYNDVEDKWIVTPVGMDFSEEEILKAIEFQEKYFEGRLYLQYRNSLDKR